VDIDLNFKTEKKNIEEKRKKETEDARIVLETKEQKNCACGANSYGSNTSQASSD
jgi:hypothetical protein